MDTTALAAFLDVLAARGVTEYAGPGPGAPGPGQPPPWVRIRLFAGAVTPKPVAATPPVAPPRREVPPELLAAGLTPDDMADLALSLEG